MWLVIFGITIIAAFASVFYMVVAISRFAGIKKLAGDKKLLAGFIAFLILAAVFAVLTFTLEIINAVVVLLHEVLFFLLFGLIMRIARRVSGKNFKVYWQGWLALGTSIVYLTIAFFLCHNVWQKDYTLSTDKSVGNLRIAMFADSHIGATFGGEGFAEHMKEIEKQSPDILLIPGDMVDDSSKKADVEKACEALGQMKLKYGVWFAYGNHDEGYFNNRDFTADEFRAMLTKNGIHILEDSYELLDDRFYVVGRLDKSVSKRMDMQELLKLVDTNKYVIVLDHEPNAYGEEAGSGADMVLSGHTHGGQLIPITYLGVLVGANDMTYGYEHINGTDFIVTSGISDWALDFKTGTKSEYVIIDVKGK